MPPRSAASGEAARVPRRAVSTRSNNFDLLRLLAAFQVLYFHVSIHLKIEFPDVIVAANRLLALFPGVPIFFVISGFLVSMSFERAPDLTSYARNRFLRLFPGLWVAFGVSLVLIGSFGFLPASVIGSASFWLWVGSQLTVFQVFNPQAFRGFGTGVVNGSLWTIPIEVTFYACVPVLYRLFVRGKSRTASSVYLNGIAAVSYAIFYVVSVIGDREVTFLYKMIDVTLAPHLYMFLFGMLLQRSWDRLAPWIEGKVLFWAAAYVVVGWLSKYVVGKPVAARGEGLTMLAAFVSVGFARTLLAVWTLSFAFSYRRLSERLLRGNDISYGVYIYHGLVLNSFVELGLFARPLYLFSVAALSVCAAAASWRWIERPALRWKKSSIHPEGAPPARSTAH